jgi:Cu/Ag efflux protein CusF
MKSEIKLFTIPAFLIVAVAFACTNGKAPINSNTATNAVEKQTYKSTGVIKNIDAENGKITIDHEDIKGYMPAMEMDFSVNEKSLIESAKVGDKIYFEIERTGEKLTITKLDKVGEVAILSGSEIYKANCASCHGDIGEGTKKGIPLVSGHALHHSEVEHIKQVADGEGEKMPAFKDKLKAEEIKAVVDFVRNDIQKGTKREDSHKHSH